MSANRLVQWARVEVKATIALTEIELAALDALAGYGVDPFLKVFYEKLGKAYLEKHEAGIRSLFEAIRSEVPRLLSQAQVAREAVAKKPLNHESEGKP